MVLDIPSTKQEKAATIPRTKGSLLTGINKLKTTQPTERFWRDILMYIKTHKIMQDSKIFYEKSQKIEQTQNFKHQLL